MKKLVDDWKDKQGIFEKHEVKGVNPELIKRMSNAQRNYIIEVLEKYNEFLEENGYADDDLWCEPPTAIDKFFLKYYPKID